MLKLHDHIRCDWSLMMVLNGLLIFNQFCVVFIMDHCVTLIFLTRCGLTKKLELLCGLMMLILIRRRSIIGMRVQARN